jgi:hypothetical protein
MSSDPYVYPGTTVLKNIPGIRNQEILDRYNPVNPRFSCIVLFFHWLGPVKNNIRFSPGLM